MHRFQIAAARGLRDGIPQVITCLNEHACPAGQAETLGRHPDARQHQRQADRQGEQIFRAQVFLPEWFSTGKVPDSLADLVGDGVKQQGCGQFGQPGIKVVQEVENDPLWTRLIDTPQVIREQFRLITFCIIRCVQFCRVARSIR